jgi:hypothetical protein
VSTSVGDGANPLPSVPRSPVLDGFFDSSPSSPRSIVASYVNLAIIDDDEEQRQKHSHWARELQRREEERKELQAPGPTDGASVERDDRDRILESFDDLFRPTTPIDIHHLFSQDQAVTNPQSRPAWQCKRHVLMLGRASIGKSTVCKTLAAKWAAGQLWSEGRPGKKVASTHSCIGPFLTSATRPTLD